MIILLIPIILINRPTVNLCGDKSQSGFEGFYLFAVCLNFMLTYSLNYNAAQICPDWYLYSFIAIFTLSVNPTLCFAFIFLSLLSKAIKDQHKYAMQISLHF